MNTPTQGAPAPTPATKVAPQAAKAAPAAAEAATTATKVAPQAAKTAFIGTRTSKAVAAAAVLFILCFVGLTSPVVEYRGTKVSILEKHNIDNTVVNYHGVAMTLSQIQSLETLVEVKQHGGYLGIPVYFGKAKVAVKQALAGSDEPVVVLYNGISQ